MFFAIRKSSVEFSSNLLDCGVEKRYGHL